MKLINLRQIDGGQALLSQVNSLVSQLNDANNRITAIQNTMFPVKENINLSQLTASQTNFILKNKPNAQKLELNINGIIYEEDD